MNRHSVPSPPPDPGTVRTPEEFVTALAELRLWAGAPSLRRLRQLAGTTVTPGGARVAALPPSTTSYVLSGRGLPRLPRMEFTRALVRACLIAGDHPAERIPDEVQLWFAAWRHVAFSSVEARHPRTAAPDLAS
ncbi:hypothetical protein AB0I72_07890 [Nocardiopsis sp. NPDC049922]|uniref:hypothetical protein n=1 Tax=Nocardiopsis sp. NPDC049922 TaxID=3155157 RepID=UPI0033C0FC9B